MLIRPFPERWLRFSVKQTRMHVCGNCRDIIFRDPGMWTCVCVRNKRSIEWNCSLKSRTLTHLPLYTLDDTSSPSPSSPSFSSFLFPLCVISVKRSGWVTRHRSANWFRVGTSYWCCKHACLPPAIHTATQSYPVLFLLLLALSGLATPPHRRGNGRDSHTHSLLIIIFFKG